MNACRGSGVVGGRSESRFGYAHAMDFRLVTLWFLAVVAGCGCGWWLLVAARVIRDLPRIPRAPHGLSLPLTGPEPMVSVIIPAHNEEAHAPRVVRSILASQWKALEVIVVLDRCTDGTWEALQPIAAADARLKLVVNDSCPADWAGKCNAARVGASHATGELLLFTDADVVFDPSLLRASVAILKHRGLSLLSLLATPGVRHWFEAIVQPVAAVMLMRMYPIPRVNDPDNPRAFANGQFMLFQRSMYEKLGGHAIVRDDLLEDIAFARRVRDAGGRGGLCTADGMLRVEMYESMAEFHKGWKRIYLEAAERAPARLRSLAMEAFVCGAVFPIVAGAAILCGGAWRGGTMDPLATVTMVLGLGCVGALVIVAGWLNTMCGAPALAAIFHPLGAWLVAHCMLEAASDLDHRRPVRWGGRDYILEPRPEGGYAPPPSISN